MFTTKNRLNHYLIFIVLWPFLALGQLSIEHPLENAVYQRNASNTANIFISGRVNQGLVSSVQVRLLNGQTFAVIPGFDWSVIHAMPTGGYFQGTLSNVPAGWYRLEVRAMRGTSQLNLSTVPFFGVGDVFIGAGQSNAQGYLDQNQSLGASQSRVISHNHGQYCYDSDMPYPSLSQLSQFNKISPNGRNAWYYGRLGDNLVAQTGFPVAFFNAAASGASVFNWKQTSDGNTTIHALTGVQFCTAAGEYEGPPSGAVVSQNPYQYFKKNIQYYNSMFGARAVLWHQGESDNFLDVSGAAYTADLNSLINKSRTDFGQTLPWVISRASYFFTGGSFSNPIVDDPNIISGQNNSINAGNQIFAGPSTDDVNNTNPSYPSSRYDDIHFSASGLVEIANRWTTALNPSFFSNSTPISAQSPPNITVNRNIDGTVTMSLPGSYLSYKWINTSDNNYNFSKNSEGNGFDLTKSSGRYRCWVKNSNGNLQISPEIDVSQYLSLVNNTGTCATNVFVSSLNPLSASNGLGPFEINKTNGTATDGDGSNIILKGTNYAQGIGVAANSDLIYQIPNNQFYSFKAFIGIGDDVAACTNTGGVRFKVYTDGTLAYTSPIIYRNSALEEINLSISGKSLIRLSVEEVVANSTCNRAVWANALFTCLAADNTPPSTPGSLTLTDTLTKCIRFTWTASTDNLALKDYLIYKNGIKVDSVNISTLNYTFKNLSRNTAFVLGLRARDLNNNLSPLAFVNISTKNLIISYSLNDDYICNNTNHLPILKIPNNGVFTFAATPPPGTTLNYTSGQFFSNTTIDSSLFQIYYSINPPISGCDDFTDYLVGIVKPPLTTPSISANRTIVNAGQPVTFTSTVCPAVSPLKWSFSNSVSNPLTLNLTQSLIYRSSCRKGECHAYSNGLNINVIPNCDSAIVISSPTNNLISNPNALKYNSSNTLISTQGIVPINNVEYNAAQTILLNPGFSVSSGVIFSAKIQNCPN
jgi:hypothetical protein